VSRGTQDAASSPVHFPLRDCHTLWSRFPSGSRSVRIGNSTYAVLQPPCVNTWVWAFPISLAATFGISVIYFPSGTEMVHFPELAHTGLCIQPAVAGVHPAGFPHSEIPGSKPACGSPRLIAACHVLHRLLAPRHPPYALSSLIIKLTQYVVSQGALQRADLKFGHYKTRCGGYTATFHWFVRPVSYRSIIPWSDCSAPGLSTLKSQVLERVRLVNPQYCSTYSSRTCNKSCHQSPRQTVIGRELSA
jgi:hypothetical protein